MALVFYNSFNEGINLSIILKEELTMEQKEKKSIKQKLKENKHKIILGAGVLAGTAVVVVSAKVFWDLYKIDKSTVSCSGKKKSGRYAWGISTDFEKPHISHVDVIDFWKDPCTGCPMASVVADDIPALHRAIDKLVNDKNVSNDDGFRKKVWALLQFNTAEF